MSAVNNFLVIFGAILVTSSAFNIKNGRIVGGDFATTGQFPHQISLREYGIHLCGGSIISDRWILTAAHCVTGNPKKFSIEVGATYLGNGTSYSVKRTIKHQMQNKEHADIALVELSTPLKMSNLVKTIKLGHSETPVGGQITISGWGATYQGGRTSKRLKYNNQLTVLDSKMCAAVLGRKVDGLMCLKHSVNNGACNGDSGGPATYNNTLVGVASFVLGSCGSKYPDGYVKVAYYVDWINSTTGLSL